MRLLLLLSFLVINSCYALDFGTWKIMDESYKGNYLAGYSTGIISGAESTISVLKNYIMDDPSLKNIEANYSHIRKFAAESRYPFRVPIKDTRESVDQMFLLAENQNLTVEDILELLGLKALGVENEKIEKHRMMLLQFKE